MKEEQQSTKDFLNDLWESEEERKQAEAENSSLDFNEEALKLKELRDRKDELEAEKKKVNADYEEQVAKFARMMKARNLSSFKIKGVGNFIHIRTTFPKIINEEKFFEFLESCGDDWMIKRSVHNATLRSWFNGNDKEGKPPALVRLEKIAQEFADEPGTVEEVFKQFLDIDFSKDQVQIRKA